MLLLSCVWAFAGESSPTGGFAGGVYLTPEPNPLQGGPEVVGRLGVRVVQPFDLEAELGWVDSETKTLQIRYVLLNPRVNALWHFTPDKRADLFIATGAGIQWVNVSRDSEAYDPGINDRALYRNPSTDFVANAGPGLILHLAGPVHLRTDLRWYGSFGSDATEEYPDTFQNLEWNLGFDLRQEDPPDRDGDGILDRDDACRDDPEDHDGFEDEDGCPELDNDADGLVDARDRCPLDAEDRDAFQDDDGCPENDNDEDGLSDRRDECPDDAEDFDRFRDDDGCPDRDNDGDRIPDSKDRCPDEAENVNGIQDMDGCPEDDSDFDGIPDKKDRCPAEPETANDYQDEDGCPDEIPKAVQKFTGVIRGITFETNKAVIRPSSEPTLEEALGVLQQFPDVRLEVQGHTDDVGAEDFNLDLSQRRAEAVVAWFVSRGVDPARLRAVGFGETRPIAENDTDAGKAENRRVEFRLIDP